MIAGSQYYVTFDGQFIQFAGSCTYLLARDFVRDQFAVLIKYDPDHNNLHHQIILLIGKEPIIVDLFKNVSITKLHLFFISFMINITSNYFNTRITKR